MQLNHISCAFVQEELRQQKEEEMDDYCSQVCLSIEHLNSIVKLSSECLNIFQLPETTLFCVIVSRSLFDILCLWFMVSVKKLRSLILLTTLETSVKSQQL